MSTLFRPKPAMHGLLVCLFLSGCATRAGLHQDVGKQFLDAAARKNTVSEISAMLGGKPVKCENLPSYPVVGLLIEDHGGPTVASVDPSGPAANSGIRKGDKILFINSKRVSGVAQGSDIITSEARADRPIAIETQRGTYSFTPQYPKSVSQCYWEILDERARSEAGSSASERSPDQGVFKGVCRFFDGRASQCQYIYGKRDH